MVLKSTSFGKGSAVSVDLLALRPEARDEALTIFSVREKKPNMDHVKDAINTRLLVATLVATMTFAAGFAVPGGFNGSDSASNDQGMATMVNKKMFQAFAICNTIAMFCSMIAVVNLIWAQQNNVYMAIAAYQHTILPLTIALPAMSAAFLTGVTLTVGKLHWLAHTVFYMGLVFLIIISGAKLLEYPPVFRSDSRIIRRLIYCLVLAYFYIWKVETYLLDDSGDDGMASGTSASAPRMVPVNPMTNESSPAKGGDVPCPPRS